MSFQVVAVGEVLWDLFPDGARLGGAPTNFAVHAAALGARAAIISRVGKDALGRQALDALAAQHVSTEWVQRDRERPTGTVTVSVSKEGAPQFTIPENVAWDGVTASESALLAMRQADAVCFGTLAQRTHSARKAIQQLLASSPPQALKLLDVNLRQAFYSPEVLESSLRLATALKVNEEELPVLCSMLSLEASEARRIAALAERFGLEVIALTRGAEGSSLYRGGVWSHRAPQAVAVIDTVGAGDAFAAALVMGLLHHKALEEVHELAADVAHFVCSQAGATPSLPEPLCKRLDLKDEPRPS